MYVCILLIYVYYRSMKAFITHMENHESGVPYEVRAYMCMLCVYLLRQSMKALITHMENHENSLAYEVRMYTCTYICGCMCT